jgi:hypothetical protein
VTALNWILVRLKVPPATKDSVLAFLDTVAQSSHIWFGGWVVFVFGLWTSPWWGALAITIFAGIKEGWYDQNYETAEIRGSNLRDFVFYVAGAALTALLLTVVR